MRKGIIGAVVAALALGGAAVAFGDNSSKIDRPDGDVVFAPAPGGIPAERGFAIAFEDGAPGDFAEDLAAELDLSVDEVEAALEAVAEKHRAEHRGQMAEAIAEHLDGVSVEAIEAAIAVAEEEMRQAIEDGDPPPPGHFAETLAEELGVSEEAIEEALRATQDAAFAEHRKEFEERVEALPEDERFPPNLPPVGPPPFVVPAP